MRKRVLIVEDNEGILQCLKLALELEGYETEIANDGKIALEKLAVEQKPDLLLLDLTMPGVDGYSVLRNLKQEKESPIHIVVMSANWHAEQRARIEGNIEAFLVKPFALAVLRKTVETILTKTEESFPSLATCECVV